MFIDTHCHLDFSTFDKSRDKILQKCQGLKISNIINPATDFSNWDKLIELKQKHSNISICFGLHPVFIDKHQGCHLELLEKYTLKNNCKLIGEIGLDKRINNFNKQLYFFEKQIQIAKKLNKKVIIHSVKSHNEIIKILKDNNFTTGGIIHAFNGNANIAKTYIQLGFKLGIGAILSLPTNRLKKTLKEIDIRNIVLETDAPDMRLYNSKSDIGEPWDIIETFELLANIYRQNPAILMTEIYKNSLEFI